MYNVLLIYNLVILLFTGRMLSIFTLQFSIVCRAVFRELSLLDESLCDGVEGRIDVLVAFRSAVHLGDIDILVDADAQRDAGERRYLCQAKLQDDAVHEGDALEVPFARRAADEFAIVLLADDGAIEQLLGEIEVGVALVLGHEREGGGGVLRKAVDGLEDEGIDYRLVVVPIDIRVLQQVGELLVAHDEVAVDESPYLAVHLVACGLARHVVLVELACLYLII